MTHLFLRPLTRALLEQVQTETRLPVTVHADAQQRTLTTVHVARNEDAAHIITYKPFPGEAPDYAICHQCLFILRAWAQPPGQRPEIASTPRGQAEVAKLLRAPDSPIRHRPLPQAQFESLQAQLLDGLVAHLRAVPLNLRVSAAVRARYPDLDAAQYAHVLHELHDNQATLRTEVRRMFPDQLYQTTQALNAAFALFWARELGEPTLAASYRGSRMERQGQALLKLYDAHPAEPEQDVGLVDRWGAHLKLAGWYTWVFI